MRLYSDTMMAGYGAIGHSEVNGGATGEYCVLRQHRNKILGED